MSWPAMAQQSSTLTALFPVTAVPAIVITQDCDALTAADITLVEIKPFADVEGNARGVTSPAKMMNLITQYAQRNFKWFYLPPEPKIPFAEKMGADFRSAITVPRFELETMRNLRRARLNQPASDHFRHRIGYFFTRYAFDEWYSLDEREFAEYTKKHPTVKPFGWQLPKKD